MAPHFICELFNDRFAAKAKLSVFFPEVKKPAVRADGSADSIQVLVLDTVQKLPDDTPLEKISEEIEFLVAVQQGLKALDEGRVVSHDDVKARVASWGHRGRK